MAESQIFEAIEENLPEDGDEADWNWEALAKTLNARWKLNLRDRDLKKIDRNELAEVLLAKAREAITGIDLGEGARFLSPDFSVRTACDWVHYKFGLKLDPQEVAGLEAADFKRLVREKGAQVYEERETEYPVLAGISHFTTQDSSGHKRVDRDALAAWASQRFDVQLDVEDLKSRQRDDIRGLLVEHSKAQKQLAANAIKEVHEQVDKLFRAVSPGETVAIASGGNGALTSLADWTRRSLKIDVPLQTLERLDREQLERRLEMAVEDRYRPEMTRMERSLVLQILDAAWKDHLLAMDHLRNSVGLRGYAQVDPKVEYKREGMRTFELMWDSVAERVTDLIFRMEQVDETAGVEFCRGRGDSRGGPRQPSPISSKKQSTLRRPTASPSRFATAKEHVGRNEPCPCGSGKKFKNCCMRKGG